MTVTRAVVSVARGVFAASLAVAIPAGAQVPGEPWSAFSLFLGGGWSDIAGGPSQGGMAGATVAGVGYERGIREGLRLRAEIVATLSNADLGFSRTISQNHIGVSTLVRRDGVSSGAGRARSYVAAGGAVLAQTVCDVDEVGGGGFLGGQTWSCTAFPDNALRWKSPVLAALVAVGVERGRYGLEIRLDQAITSSLASPSGSMRPRHASVIFNDRLRRRS